MRFPVRTAAVAVAAALAVTVATVTPATSAETTYLETGHVDAIAGACPTEGVLDLTVRYDGTGGEVDLDPASTVLVALPRSQVVVPDGISPAYHQILGPAGSVVWVLPEAQDPTILWPGWDFEEVADCFHHDGDHDEGHDDDGDHDHDGDGGHAHVELSLVQATGPGRAVVYLSGFEPTVLFDSASALPQRFETGASHGHANWAFHAPGTYALTFAVRAHFHHDAESTAPAEDEVSGTITVRFEVRGDAPPPPPSSSPASTPATPSVAPRFTG